MPFLLPVQDLARLGGPGRGMLIALTLGLLAALALLTLARSLLPDSAVVRFLLVAIVLGGVVALLFRALRPGQPRDRRRSTRRR